MAERLTSEQAKTVPLPPRWRPFKRLAQLAAYGSAYGLKNGGRGPHEVNSRASLVNLAESTEAAEEMLTAVRQIERNGQVAPGQQEIPITFEGDN